jgi:hypothetical protein
MKDAAVGMTRLPVSWQRFRRRLRRRLPSSLAALGDRIQRIGERPRVEVSFYTHNHTPE